MKLHDLLQEISVESVLAPTHPTAEAWERVEIGSVHYRAQEVRPGGLFVAIKGFVSDGHAYLDQAIARGAAAVVVQQPVQCDTAAIRVPDTRRALALLASRFYGQPSQTMCIVGITGTNGKTTTAYLIEQILAAQGLPVGVIGTINYRFAGRTFDNPVTTPESLDLQRILAEMAAANISHVVMEVSSHALDLSRIAGCYMDIGVFTNLSQDHLDYHGDMDAYWACKRRLFTEYLRASTGHKNVQAVINTDDRHGRALAKDLTMPVIKTGSTGSEDVWAQDIVCDLNGIQAHLHTPGASGHIRSQMIGRHNLENILSAAGAGLATGQNFDAIQTGIRLARHVPGRLEKIGASRDRHIYVDYAHTPAALENVLKALRNLAHSRVICVFGCGGNRDREKRPQMGGIAVAHCDLAVITSDNPRDEPPMEIIGQIASGINAPHIRRYAVPDLERGWTDKGYVIEPDRRTAIRLAIMLSQPEDTILIAGKGHETYQVLGQQTIAFDDREEARQAVQMLLEKPSTTTNG